MPPVGSVQTGVRFATRGARGELRDAWGQALL